MSDTLQTTEDKVTKDHEIPVESNALQGSSTEPDPPCCRLPGDPDGGPDT